MSSLRAVSITMLILVGIFCQLNPSYIDNILERDINNSSQYELIKLQENEEWLVLSVSFPNKPFMNNKAEEMFEGEYSASSYIKSLDSSSNLNITLFDVEWKSTEDESFWGKDSDSSRDQGVENGVQDLIHETVTGLLSETDLSKWDFDDDGIVDRLLILHSGGAQESNGDSSAIWSHFSGLDNPIEISKWSIEHYTIVSLSSGLGTLMHEMLHQMGAVDLYDVHSDSPSSNWNGLGTWDIMASGNWNGNGDIPALPSSSTMDLIGLDRYIPIIPENNQSFSLLPLSSDGISLSVEIAPGEIIWISLRSGGFDSSLPGSGILVEQQDKNNGNLEYNLVNIDPEIAWVKIIEADGNDGLLRGRNSGESSDLFDLGDSFGNKGIKIRDNRGRLVQWTATVSDVSLSSNGLLIGANITFENQNNNILEVLTPRNPIQLLPNAASYATVHSNESCNLIINLNLNGNNVLREFDLLPGETQIEIINSSDYYQNKGHIRGTIGCQGLVATDIDIDWVKIGHTISNDLIEDIIPWNENSELFLYPEYYGNGSRIYSISISGAIGRIATPITQGNIDSGDPIVLAISPNGLLKQGMVAKGELVLLDSNSIEQRIPILLQSESPFVGEGWIPWLSQPSNGIFLICILLSLSLLTSRNKRLKTVID